MGHLTFSHDHHCLQLDLMDDYTFLSQVYNFMNFVNRVLDERLHMPGQ